MHPAPTQQTWKPKTSVKMRYALVQGFFIAVIIGLIASALYFPIRYRFQTLSESYYQRLALNLQTAIADDYRAGKREAVVSAVRQTANQEGVHFVLIVAGDGTVYYDSLAQGPSLEGQKVADELSVQSLNAPVVVGDSVRNGTTYITYVSSFTADNQTHFTVRVAVDKSSLVGEFNRLGLFFLYVGLAGSFLGIVISYILAARLTRPIAQLTQTALAIRSGTLKAYPHIATGDEIEQLSREFQGMVENLKQFYYQEYAQKNEALSAKKRLEEINARLRELDRQKTDFLNAASHQLRTPLSVIHWSLSLIADEAVKWQIPKDQLELVEDSLRSTKRMVDMVNDMLDISRIEQGRKDLTWATGNYAKVCEELVDALRPLAQKKGLQLQFELLNGVPDSYIDEKAFYQVINNFVDNAIKYTEHGYVKVNCRFEHGRTIVTISDTGIGMDQEDKKRLFMRFARGMEATKMFPNGSGLGMYVAQTLLKQMGGEITVESEKGKGTIFTLVLPIYEHPPKSPDERMQFINNEQYTQVGAKTSHEPSALAAESEAKVVPDNSEPRHTADPEVGELVE